MVAVLLGASFRSSAPLALGHRMAFENEERVWSLSTTVEGIVPDTVVEILIFDVTQSQLTDHTLSTSNSSKSAAAMTCCVELWRRPWRDMSRRFGGLSVFQSVQPLGFGHFHCDYCDTDDFFASRSCVHSKQVHHKKLEWASQHGE